MMDTTAAQEELFELYVRLRRLLQDYELTPLLDDELTEVADDIMCIAEELE